MSLLWILNRRLRRLTTDSVFSPKSDTSVLGHTGLLDDDSDAKGDQIFLRIEIANLVEEGEDEDDLEGSAHSSEEAAGGGPSAASPPLLPRGLRLRARAWSPV